MCVTMRDKRWHPNFWDDELRKYPGLICVTICSLPWAVCIFIYAFFDLLSGYLIDMLLCTSLEVKKVHRKAISCHLWLTIDNIMPKTIGKLQAMCLRCYFQVQIVTPVTSLSQHIHTVHWWHSVGQTIKHKSLGWLLNNEFKRSWK